MIQIDGARGRLLARGIHLVNDISGHGLLLKHSGGGCRLEAVLEAARARQLGSDELFNNDILRGRFGGKGSP